jgi:hypothetical protein
MKKQILNVINQLLAYDSANGVSDTPNLKAFDWTRRMTALPISNSLSDSFTLFSGETRTLFSSAVANPLDNTSVLSITNLQMPSLYRLSVTAGTSGFRTARSLSLINATVTVNNNAQAVFSFPSGTLGATQVGDVMRIKSLALGDTAPFAFNPLNGGLWQIIGLTATSVTCIRPVCAGFQGVSESVSTVGADVQIYSAAGVQKGDKMLINGGFSSITQRTFEVKDVTPTTIDFCSTQPLPSEAGIAYTTDMIDFFGFTKKFFYVEADQECVVYLNGNDGSSIIPVQAGNTALPGFLNTTGEIYSCSVLNKSINPLNLKLFTAE